ncbi:hypothetical protein KP509_04G014100 [Ceratopteris richardii]|nr:hypothetical protein KP509_04G014100 [Ceratopteris richardii]
MPGLKRLRKGIIAAARSCLQPLLTTIPFCLFLLLDIYWKYENMPKCEGAVCSAAEHTKHSKSIMKSQRNFVLVLAAPLLYWLLYSATNMLVQVEKLNLQVEQLKQHHSD